MVAVVSDQITVATIIAVVALTAGAVAALLGLRGDTREAIEAESDKKISEAREHETQLINVGREWREQWQAVEELREKQETRHAAETKDYRDRIESLTSDLAVAKNATDLSGLETRMSAQFAALMGAQEQQTQVLASLAETVATLAQRISPDTPIEGAS